MFSVDGTHGLFLAYDTVARQPTEGFQIVFRPAAFGHHAQSRIAALNEMLPDVVCSQIDKLRDATGGVQINDQTSGTVFSGKIVTALYDMASTREGTRLPIRSLLVEINALPVNHAVAI
jgi:hypothetical protein